MKRILVRSLLVLEDPKSSDQSVFNAKGTCWEITETPPLSRGYGWWVSSVAGTPHVTADPSVFKQLKVATRDHRHHYSMKRILMRNLLFRSPQVTTDPFVFNAAKAEGDELPTHHCSKIRTRESLLQLHDPKSQQTRLSSKEGIRAERSPDALLNEEDTGEESPSVLVFKSPQTHPSSMQRRQAQWVDHRHTTAQWRGHRWGVSSVLDYPQVTTDPSIFNAAKANQQSRSRQHHCSRARIWRIPVQRPHVTTDPSVFNTAKAKFLHDVPGLMQDSLATLRKKKYTALTPSSCSEIGGTH